MSKRKSFYDEFGSIKDEYINDAMEQNAPKKGGNIRTVIEAVACVAIVCGFIGLSLFMRRVSAPKNPALSADMTTETADKETGTEAVSENQTSEGDTEAAITETESLTEREEIPDTEGLPEPSAFETDDKFFIKLYVAAYNRALGVTPDGVVSTGKLTGIGRNPDRVSNELPGIEALGLKETVTKDEAHGIIGKFAGGVSLADDETFFWDYKTPDGDTFCVSAHYIAVEDASDWSYGFDKYPLIRLKIEVLKAEMQKDGISADEKEGYEKTLSDLYLELDGCSAEYCKESVEFARCFCSFEIEEKNDTEYAAKLVNTVFSAIMDYMQGKRAYTDLDADDDLRRLVYEGFILEDFCGAVSENRRASDILNKVFRLSDKINIRNSEYLRTHEVSPYTEYDYLINYGKNEEYSEYVRISTRYDAVFYYKETPGKDTVYSLIYKDKVTYNDLDPELIRKNAVSADEFEKETDIKINFNYDQELIAVYLDRIYSHPGTTELTYRLGQTEEEKNAEANKRLTDLGVTDTVFNRRKPVSPASVFGGKPFIIYDFSEYPEEYSFNSDGDNKRVITNINICSDAASVCGININSSYDEFERVFSELGFDVERSEAGVTATIRDGGLRISLSRDLNSVNDGIRNLSLVMPPITRSIVYY